MTNSTTTITDQIFEVLAESYPEPVHYRQVTEHLVANGAWDVLPKTPENTVSNRITSDLSRNGDDSVFRRIGNKGTGIYTVNPSYLVDQTYGTETSSSSVSSFFGRVFGYFTQPAFWFGGAVVVGVQYALNYYNVI